MQIGMVIENNYPLDREVRTHRVAKTLDREGHSVTIFALNSRTDTARGAVMSEWSPRSEELAYATVQRFSWLVSVPGLSVLARPFPFNPFWSAWLFLNLARENLDLVIASDIRAGPTTIVAAKVLGIPVIVDVRENYVEFAKVLFSESFVDRLLLNTWIIGILESFIFRLADEVWVVTEERKDALDVSLRERSSVTVVQNVPKLTGGSGDDHEGPIRSFEPKWSGFTFVYVGVLNDFRGLDPLVEALAHLPDVEDVHLAIAGEGPHRESLEALARRLGVEEDVTFTGWIDSSEVPAFIATGDIGVIPHEVNGFTNTTLPNKLFDYMSQGLPVLTTDMAPVARIVRREDCGVIIPEGSTARKIAEIMTELRHSDRLGELGENGRDAIERRYNWETESEKVIESVIELTQRSG